MNMLKNIMTAILFIGIGGWYAVNAQKPDTQLKKIEARIDAKLKKMGLYIPPAPPSTQSSSVASVASVAGDSATLIVNKSVKGDNCRFYAFNYMKELEHLLKVIAESHWKINDANDKYVNIKNMASVEKNKGNYAKAADLLNKAQVILNASAKWRKSVNDEFEGLLRNGKSFYNTKNVGTRTSFTNINKEFTAFIVETAEGGKYVRAWAFHAKGGMEVTISGRKVIIDKQ